VRWIDNQEDLVLKAVGNKGSSKVTTIAVKNKYPLGITGFSLSISMKHILKLI
jgi:hypothetical protein